jgi:chloramphenicol-sensitive protein RarD
VVYTLKTPYRDGTTPVAFEPVAYFMARLAALVLVGYYLYGERLSPAQWTATAVAIVAVVSSVVNTGGFSWVALAVVVGYPLYFMLRRRQPIPVLITVR